MRLALLFLCTLAVTGCVRHLGAPEGEPPALPDYNVAVIEDRVYTPDDWPQALHADLYRPQPNGRYPAVLMVHGGGWERRSPEDTAALSRLSLIHISEPTRQAEISYAVFCLKKKKSDIQ